MNDSGGLAKLVPGFDFLQNLAKSAGSAIPGLGGFGQWIAPTLDPAEIEKRIEELKTVQFWLEQNARMLATTIQALEVQRMTLATLKTMNVQLGEAKSMLTGGKAPFAPAATDGADASARTADAMPRPPSRSAARAAALAPPVVDPMQWWSALTSQFTELATQTLKDTATDAAKAVAGSVLRGSAQGAKATLRRAAALPGKVAGAAGAAGAAAVGAAGAALAPRKKAAKRRLATTTTTKGRNPSLRSG